LSVDAAATVTEAGGVTGGAAGGVGGEGGAGGEAPWLTCVGTGRDERDNGFDARARSVELWPSPDRATRLCETSFLRGETETEAGLV
jgi:hypothetical protein